MPHMHPRADVAPVRPDQLYLPMRLAIAQGHGLALLNGLTEIEMRALEEDVWSAFPDDPQTRLAVALRFRALVEVCACRRLQELFKMQGFKFIARAVHEAAVQRLNARFGFNAQKFVIALDHQPAAMGTIRLREIRALAA